MEKTFQVQLGSIGWARMQTVRFLNEVTN